MKRLVVWTSIIAALALSDDGTRLILGSKTGEVQIWDTAIAGKRDWGLKPTSRRSI